jgi:hypothetical protein
MMKTKIESVFNTLERLWYELLRVSEYLAEVDQELLLTLAVPPEHAKAR